MVNDANDEKSDRVCVIPDSELDELESVYGLYLGKDMGANAVLALVDEVRRLRKRQTCADCGEDLLKYGGECGSTHGT